MTRARNTAQLRGVVFERAARPRPVGERRATRCRRRVRYATCPARSRAYRPAHRLAPMEMQREMADARSAMIDPIVGDPHDPLTTARGADTRHRRQEPL